jgi:hypothetical protein
VIERAGAVEHLLATFASQITALETIFARAGQDEITGAVFSVVSYMIQNAEQGQAAAFAGRIFDDLSAHAQNRRAVPHYINMIVVFMARDPEWALDNGWIRRVIGFVKGALEGNKSYSFAQSFNAASFFLFLTDHLFLASPVDVTILCSVGAKILQSPAQSEAFMQLIFKCIESDLVQMDTFVDTLLGGVRDSSPQFLVTIFVRVATSEDRLKRLLASPRVLREPLIAALARSADDPSVRAAFLDPGTKALFHLLVGGSVAASKDAVVLLISIIRCQRHRGNLALGALTASLFEGMAEINADPGAFLNVPYPDHALAVLLGAVGGALDMGYGEPSERDVETVIRLFETLARWPTPMEPNLEALIKLVQVLGPRSFESLRVHFDRLLEIILSLANDKECPEKVPRLLRWGFGFDGSQKSTLTN